MAFPAGFITPWHLKIGATQVERTGEWGWGGVLSPNTHRLESGTTGRLLWRVHGPHGDGNLETDSDHLFHEAHICFY